METLFGFVAGYIAGCSDGQDGLKKLRDSARAIVQSDEVKRLAAEAIGFAQVAARRAASGRSLTGLSGTVGTVTEMLAERASSVGKGPRAA